MTYLLDTNTCIGWLRNNQPLIVSRVDSHDPSDLVLCSVVVGELLYGVERSDPKHQANALDRVEKLRSLFASMPFDDFAAEEYGKIRAILTARGQIIGGNDLMIAAIVNVNKCILVTHNVAEFSRVPGLRLEDWQV